MTANVSDLIAAMILEGFTYPVIVRILGRLPPVFEDADCLPPVSLETVPPIERYVRTESDALSPTLPCAT